MNNLPGSHLLVPIRLDALVLNDQGNGENWADLTPQFNLTTQEEVLGDQISPDLFTTGNPPPAGIHLHWSLPAALTHGQAAGGSTADLTFPLVPNRWLLTRIASDASSQQIHLATWVVASDELEFLPSPPAFRTSWPLPEGRDWLNDAAYLGRPYYYAEPSSIDRSCRQARSQLEAPLLIWPGDSGPQDLFLTALGPGNPGFAAYYPDCHSVFGFWDDLCDLGMPVPEAGIELTYLVTGWYSDPAADPLYGCDQRETWNARMAELGWSVQDSASRPTQTLYHAMVYGVLWNGPQGGNGSGIPETPEVAVGNSPIEALAALVGNKLSQYPLAADLLEAFEYDLLDQLGNGDVAVDRALHTRAFSRHRGGTFWEIRKTPGSDPPPLAGRLGALLGELNTAQDLYDRSERQLTGLRQQVYFAWYKRTFQEEPSGPLTQGEASPPTVPQLTTFTNDLIQQTMQSVAETTACQGEVDALAAQIRTQLPADYELASVPRARFWQPSDLAVVLGGDAATRTSHRESDDHSAGIPLPCRLRTDMVTGLTVKPPQRGTVIVTAEQLAAYDGAFPQGAPIPEEIPGLLVEALLLDPSEENDQLLARAAWRLAGVSNPTTDQLTELAATINGLQQAPYAGLVGTPPAELAVASWKAPWNPLYLMWSLRWFPSYGSNDMSEPGWNLGRDWQLGETDSTWSGANPTANPSRDLQDFVLMTPHVSFNLKGRLESYIDSHPHAAQIETLEAILQELGNLDVLSQRLSGLDDSLRMHEHTLQLPLISLGNPGDDQLAAQVDATIAGMDGMAPHVEGGYFPVRAGHATLAQLWIVDGFGQVLKVIDPSASPVTPVVAESLRTQGNDSGLMQLAPRLSQPARLDFRWRSAENDQIETNSQPETTPVCGWVLPNHLDRSLMVYAADGTALGELQCVDGAGGGNDPGLRWRGVPGQPSPVGAPPDLPNRHLQGFIAGLLAAGIAGGDPLQQFLPVIDETLWLVDPLGARQDLSLSVLIGRPLALVRASLELELDGLPAADQSWDATTWQVENTTNGQVPFQHHGFLDIPFPVRLGDTLDLEDGLIGFFLEDDDAYGTFYATHKPQSLQPGSYVNFNTVLNVQPNGQPQFLSLLVDPRAAVHATSGLLPCKRVQVPPVLIQPALQRMDVTFRTGPVLSRAQRFAMPLPAGQAGTWSWLDQPGVAVWEEKQKIGAPQTKATLASSPLKVYEGWLALSGSIGRNSGKATGEE